MSYAPPLLSGAVARAAPRDPGRRRPSGAAAAADVASEDSKDLHMELPKHPGDVPHLHDLEAAPIPAEHMAAWLANYRRGKRAPRL